MSSLNHEKKGKSQKRLERRKKLLLYVLAPLVALVMLAFFFMRTGLYNILFSINVANKSYGFPTSITEFQKFANIIEPYLAYYNSGYLKLIQSKTVEDLDAAQQDFEESLKANPPEEMLCAVYGNLSYTIELKGRYAFDSQNYNEAIVLYNQAEALLYKNGCASKDSSSQAGSDQQSEDAKERIKEERNQAVAAANNGGGDEGNGGGEDGGDGDNPDITDEQLQQINQNQQSAAQSAPGYIHPGGGGQGGMNSISDPNF